MRDARGQATVEVLALLPVLVLAGLALFTVLAAGRARDVAVSAAQAGAMAALAGGDPRAAARDVVTPADRRGMTVRVSGRRVTVTVRPRIPLARVGDRLAATSTADAGPGAGR